MKKRLAGMLLCAALLLSTAPWAGAAAFDDISDAQTAVAAAALQGLGVVSGTPEGDFLPDSTLTRAQVCVMAVNMMGLSGQVNTYARKTLFTDVPSTAWYNGYVNLAYREGIINGYGNGKFGPDDIITYGQLSTILLRMLDYTTQEIGSVWPMDYTAFAAQLGLSDGLKLGDNAAVSRGQAAVLFYRTLKTKTKGTDREFYRTIGDLNTTQEAILLDTDATYGGQNGLVMAYSLDGDMLYYHQSRTQNAALQGSLGQLLFDAAGKVMGFVPESNAWEDITIASATASAVKDASGRSLRVSSGVPVIVDGETYTYHNGGHIQINAKQGKTLRVFYGEDGSILCLYLAGETSGATEAVVADSANAIEEFESDLKLSGETYSITKNGAPADENSLSQYDVAYYDAASDTLRVSDYRVEGYLTAASPSVAAAETITVSGAQLEVLECAWDTLGEFELGDKLTVLLTDDNKVAAVRRSSKLDTEMIGVLDTQGKSIAIVGSGVTLTAAEMDYDKGMPGTLVRVKAQDEDTLTCSKITSDSLTLNVRDRRLGSYELADSCAIYEWAGGYVYDLVGNRGEASYGLDAIDWTDELSSSSVSYYHLNGAGEVDILLLEDVTGNLYTYGEVTTYTGREGLDDNDAAAVTNASGTSEKYLCTIQVKDGSYVGLAIGKGLDDRGQVKKICALEKLTGVDSAAFFREDGIWYVAVDEDHYPVSDDVQVHLTAADSWLSGEDGLMSALADSYTLTLYADRTADEGGQIRIAAAAK